MANSNLKKDELLQLVDKLKAELKSLKDVKKTQEVDASVMPSKAFGISRIGKNDYRVIEISYDTDKNAAIISKTHKVEPNAPHMVAFKLNELMQEEVREKMKEML